MPGTNTVPSITDTLRETGIASLTARLAPLRMFCSQIPVDTNGPKRPIEAAICTAGATTQTNATNWESGDSTVENRTITVSQISQSFHYRSEDLNASNVTVKSLTRKNADAFATKIWQTVSAALTEVNYTAVSWTGGLADLVVASPKSASRFLLCDTAFYSGIMPTSLIGGPAQHPAFANGVHEISDWTGAGAGVRGFCGDPASLIVAVGVPLSPEGIAKFVSQETVTLPQLNIPVMFSSWAVAGSRFYWFSYDVMIGAVKGDSSAAVLLK